MLCYKNRCINCLKGQLLYIFQNGINIKAMHFNDDWWSSFGTQLKVVSKEMQNFLNAEIGNKKNEESAAGNICNIHEKAACRQWGWWFWSGLKELYQQVVLGFPNQSGNPSGSTFEIMLKLLFTYYSGSLSNLPMSV
ncbi:UNVERIFIED_CONTAM: hypothetical protein K2H54_024535 [Gekko kuhli]